LAWQVDEDTTLFDYLRGESVEHFRVAHPDPIPIKPSDDDRSVVPRRWGRTRSSPRSSGAPST
jgi:hypothetical protein